MKEADIEQPETIPGYDFGSTKSAVSPLTLDELKKLEVAVGLTEEDNRWLVKAGEILTPQANRMVDAWRVLLKPYEHLRMYSSHPDGTPDKAYGAATHPRFARWIIDACTRPRDQAWLNYQQEIGLRHTRAKKNQTDGSDSPHHIPLRYLLAFAGPVIMTTREFLSQSDYSASEIEAMHAAWTKVVILSVTLWSRSYVSEANW